MSGSRYVSIPLMAGHVIDEKTLPTCNRITLSQVSIPLMAGHVIDGGTSYVTLLGEKVGFQSP